MAFGKKESVSKSDQPEKTFSGFKPSIKSVVDVNALGDFLGSLELLDEAQGQDDFAKDDIRELTDTETNFSANLVKEAQQAEENKGQKQEMQEISSFATSEIAVDNVHKSLWEDTEEDEIIFSNPSLNSSDLTLSAQSQATQAIETSQVAEANQVTETVAESFTVQEFTAQETSSASSDKSFSVDNNNHKNVEDGKGDACCSHGEHNHQENAFDDFDEKEKSSNEFKSDDNGLFHVIEKIDAIDVEGQIKKIQQLRERQISLSQQEQRAIIEYENNQKRISEIEKVLVEKYGFEGDLNSFAEQLLEKLNANEKAIADYELKLNELEEELSSIEDKLSQIS